jgi:precorrin-6B methylase 1
MAGCLAWQALPFQSAEEKLYVVERLCRTMERRSDAIHQEIMTWLSYELTCMAVVTMAGFALPER